MAKTDLRVKKSAIMLIPKDLIIRLNIHRQRWIFDADLRVVFLSI
jgi:hypothetical protein